MPRRKKPFYRLRNIAITLGLIFAFAIGREVYLAVTAVPGESTNFATKVAALIEAGQPKDAPVDSPNAAELLDRAIAIEAGVQADFRSRIQMPQGHMPVDYSLLRGPMSTKPYGQAVFDMIKANSIQAIENLGKTECFDLLDQAAASKRAVRPTPISGHLIGILLPNLGRHRNLARLNGAHGMYLAFERGEAGEAELVRTYEQTLALGRITSHGSFLIEYLVAIAIDALAMNEIREQIVERPPSERALLGMLAAMDRQPLAPISYTVEGEKLAVLDTIQWTHTDDGRGSGRLITSKMNEVSSMWGTAGGMLQRAGTWKIMNLGGAAFPSKAANVRRADEFFSLVDASLGKPYYTRGNAGKKIDEYAEHLPVRYVLLRMMLPSWGKTVQTMDQHQTSWEGTRAMLAIEIFKHRQGRYPNTLDEIVPSVLPAMPLDPFTGKPFGYHLMDPAKDPRGQRYLLYSFGSDQKDDAGAMAKNNFEALRPRVGRGYDFVINEPRTLPEPDEPEPQGPDPALGEVGATAPTPAPAPTGGESPAPGPTSP